MAATLSPQQQQTARMLYQLGRSRGLNHQRSLEFVSAAYSESGLQPDNYYGKSAGKPFVPGRTAGGLYELLSSGYVGKAQQLGGILKARPNALAILPSYLKYWHDHPGAAPGQGGAAVEASGEGAGFYSKGLGLISSLIGAGGPATSTSVPQTSAPVAQAPPVVDTGPLRQQALQALISTIGQKTPDRSGFLGGLQAVKQAETQNAAAPAPTAPAAPAANLKVHVQNGVKVSKAAIGAVSLAKEYLGTAYHWGGSSPKTGFDCSGLLQYAYAKQGVNIPRTTYEQFKSGSPVQRGQLRAGDAVFFEPTRAGPGHTGIYLGNGTFLEAPHTGANVRISKLAGRTDYVGARRYS